MDKFENINSSIDLSAQWLIPDTQSAMLAIVSSQSPQERAQDGLPNIKITMLEPSLPTRKTSAL